MPIRFLAIGVIAGLAAACSGGGGTDPTPSPTPPVGSSVRTSAAPSTPAPSRTGPLTTGPNVRPGEKPPRFPAQARQRTAQGALAMALYYFKAYDWGYATNDGSLVAAIVEPTCAGCEIYLHGLQSLHRRGEVLKGGRVSIPSSSVTPNTYKIDADYVADVVLDEEPIVIVGASGAKTVTPATRAHHSLVFLRWRSGRWSVAEVSAK